MGWRFRRTAQILPGLRLGITNKGASLRVGPKGLGWTINSKGQQRISAGIPGTGLHYSEAIGAKKSVRGRRRTTQAIEAMPADPYPWEVEEDRQRREMQAVEASEFGFLDYPAPAPPKPSMGQRIGKVAVWGFASFGALCAAVMVLGSR